MRTLLRLLLFALPLNALAGPKAAPPAPAPSLFQLVESAPVETELNHPDIPDAADVWISMIDGAKQRVDLSHFYVVSAPGSRLEDVIAALERAGKRGVSIRFLVDAKFRGSNPADLERVDRIKNLELRRIDFGLLAGGVQHAKYMVVDGREAFVGSQNFDWRSLEHIQELGVRVAEPGLVAAVADVFETDWALAGGAPRDARVHQCKASFPVAIGEGEAALQVTPALSPTGWIPDEALYDLPQIVGLIDGAKRSVRVQLLNYKATERQGYWEVLESAIRRAAGRGVQVELMMADWSAKQGTIEGLQSLEVLPNLEVRLVSIPAWSGGFIPFARVVHAKYLVVDGQRAWLGTSNWSRDYFVQTRGVGFVVEGASFAGTLDRLFEEAWRGPYAAAVQVGVTYTPPRISE